MDPAVTVRGAGAEPVLRIDLGKYLLENTGGKGARDCPQELPPVHVLEASHCLTEKVPLARLALQSGRPMPAHPVIGHAAVRRVVAGMPNASRRSKFRSMVSARSLSVSRRKRLGTDRTVPWIQLKSFTRNMQTVADSFANT
jgi:hypothetical protein